MSTESRLRDLTTQLEAAKDQAEEKRQDFRNTRAIFNREVRSYDLLLRAAFAYASAADSVEELIDEFEGARIDAYGEWMAREAEALREVGA